MALTRVLLGTLKTRTSTVPWAHLAGDPEPARPGHKPTCLSRATLGATSQPGSPPLPPQTVQASTYELARSKRGLVHYLCARGRHPNLLLFL